MHVLVWQRVRMGKLGENVSVTNFGDVTAAFARGAELRRRRLAAGIKSVRELQQRSGISREAITSAEAGTASAATYERLDAWLSRQEQSVATLPSSALIEFEVQNDEGIRIVVRGPLSDAEMLERSVARIVRDLRHDRMTAHWHAGEVADLRPATSTPDSSAG